jgi:hypothetical protein
MRTRCPTTSRGSQILWRAEMGHLQNPANRIPGKTSTYTESSVASRPNSIGFPVRPLTSGNREKSRENPHIYSIFSSEDFQGHLRTANLFRAFFGPFRISRGARPPSGTESPALNSTCHSTRETTGVGLRARQRAGRVEPNGSNAEKHRKLSLGKCPEVTLALARERQLEAHNLEYGRSSAYSFLLGAGNY